MYFIKRKQVLFCTYHDFIFLSKQTNQIYFALDLFLEFAFDNLLSLLVEALRFSFCFHFKVGSLELLVVFLTSPSKSS